MVDIANVDVQGRVKMFRRNWGWMSGMLRLWCFASGFNKKQEAEKCADLWARTEQETRFTEKSKNRLRHRTDFLGQTSVRHGKECYGAVCRSFSHPHPAVQTRSLLTSFLHRQVQGFSATHISVHPESCIVSTYWSWNILCLSFVLETQVLDSLSERTKILPQT